MNSDVVNHGYLMHSPVFLPVAELAGDDPSPEAGVPYLRAFLDRAGVAPHSALASERIAFPPTHSFLDAPESALRVAYDIAGAAVAGAGELWFDQRNCTQVDLCAESVACALAKQAKSAGIKVVGEYPAVLGARASVASFGVPAVLKDFIPEPTTESSIWPLQQQIRPDGLLDSPLREHMQSEVIPTLLDHRFRGYALNPEFARYLSTFLVEALDNAAEHGAGDWWSAATLRAQEGETRGRCQIVIFNFGETIHQTFLQLPANSARREEYEGILRHHQQSGFFDDTWTEENFWTLGALQSGASRWGEVPSRGMGTVAIIRFFDYLASTSCAATPPRMRVVSGRTTILFDGRYRLPEQRELGRQIGVAFNPPNNLMWPANPSAVQALQRHFPGTLISIQFNIAPDHLQQLPGSSDESYETP
ncbi:MAG TPA: hypothetical protein VGR37_02595 [Longimicrobiaceae bacterium]|nr:hypothetical protein [Longimicrobiaceae bacterium]